MTAAATSTSHPWRSQWSAPTLTDKQLVLAGRMSKWDKESLVELIAKEGGTVVAETSPEVNIVVVLASGANPPPAAKKAEQLNKKGATIAVLTLAEFAERLNFTGHEALLMFRAGEVARERWNGLCKALEEHHPPAIVLPTDDLRGLDLSGFLLRGVRLHGVDLTGAKLNDATLKADEGTKLDGAQLREALHVEPRLCSLIGADLTEAFFVSRGAAASDFTGAKLTGAKFFNFASGASKFVSADLSSASLHACDLREADFTKANLQGALIHKAKADGASFAEANLAGASAAASSFQRADFRRANLRGANLFQSDFTGAQLDGADLTDANIAQAKLSDEQLAVTIGRPAPRRAFQAGPAFAAMEAAKQGYCGMNLTLQTPWGLLVALLSGRPSSHGLPSMSLTIALKAYDSRHDRFWYRMDLVDLQVPNTHRAFEMLFDFIGPEGTVPPDNLQSYHSLTTDALCEMFGLTVPSAEERAAAEADRQARRAELKKTMLAELTGGPAGVQAFSARPADDFNRMDHFAKADLKKANLDGLKVSFWISFSGSKFDGASLVNAEVGHADWSKTSFNAATLKDSKITAILTGAKFKNATVEGVVFDQAELSKTVFTGAKLSGCLFKQCSLLGADLSEVTISDCRFVECSYNERTLFPPGFDASELIWKGPGLPPHELAAEQAKAEAALASAGAATGDGSDVADAIQRAHRRNDFMTKVKQNLDKAKIDKALKMLKADKFELFVETKDDHLVGVVKSQSDPDLVYACRLASDGSYQCCTQNLNVCGGLRGSPCKHLLVLAIGLERNDAVPPEKLGLWIASSRNRQTTLDKEKMGEVLLRYKGALAGELDWRPTETTPEDFYAF